MAPASICSGPDFRSYVGIVEEERALEWKEMSWPNGIGVSSCFGPGGKLSRDQSCLIREQEIQRESLCVFGQEFSGWVVLGGLGGGGRGEDLLSVIVYKAIINCLESISVHWATVIVFLGIASPY